MGGQNEIQETALWNSYPLDIAKNHSGYAFILEHRYYGQSIPVDDLSIDNLKWLNIEQALADISVFIDFVRNNIVRNRWAKIILVGGQYGGTLSVWYHQLYPGIVSGVWASSAPLLAKIDNADTLRLTGEVFRDVGGNECYERIHRGFEIAEALYANRSLEEFEKEFSVCTLSNTDYDIRFFFSTITAFFSRMVEVGG